ncbi:type I DNA topoisomerase [Patescibacteria group bacterium]|nr:type I DNA topoisomerase [Patescibacteria group bacterium]
MKNLMIVESPAKAKTIERILGKDYRVVASFGHVRDLPKSKLGVDLEHDFQPQYIVPAKARKTVKMLKDMFKKADKVYLATDLDREGEAIAWHIVEAVKPKKDQEIKRVVFSSITKSAVNEAMGNSRSIDFHLVDAQQARRVLDRLVGYKLSPLLWKKIFKGLSAGRVQSVALRLIVEREREIEKFKPEEYWSIEGDYSQEKSEVKFRAKLIKVNDEEFKSDNQKYTKDLEKKMEGAKYEVVGIKSKEKSRQPHAPYITSTLQQDAYRKLGFTAKKTMLLAQKLYEGQNIDGKQMGLITYMRTDSRNISPEALSMIRKYIGENFDDKYLPEKPVFYKKAGKNVQEAHEAVRVTYASKTPDIAKSFLDKDMGRLYELIWKRTMACQMMPARYDTTSLDIEGEHKDDKFIFRANGIKMLFDGFLKVWDYSLKNGEDVVLPELVEKEKLDLKELFVEQHFTKPPARYSEATLVKELEKNGVGRPSTYASIMSTIQTRGYVQKEEKKFVPQEVGMLVNDFLVKHFANIVDVKFTAKMEDELDEIAVGKKEWVPVVRDFYEPFAMELREKEKNVKKEEVVGKEKIDEKCPECGKELQVKFSRYGKFVACTGFPECKYTKPLDVSEEDKKKVEEAAPCEKCGGAMIIKKSRYGSFLACSNYPKCKNIRSMTSQLDIDCPKCDLGKVVEKRSKKGRVFYGCSGYPKCDFAVWNEPTEEKCEKCGFIMTKYKSGKLGCEQCKKKDKLEDKGKKL